MTPPQPVSEAVASGSASPFAAVDNVQCEWQGSGWALHATKRVEAASPYMAAHFPGFTVYPGVFVLETLRQAVGTALGAPGEGLPDFAALRSVRFLAPVLAGDVMTVDATVEPMAESHGLNVRATCRRSDGTVTARAHVEFTP